MTAPAAQLELPNETPTPPGPGDGAQPQDPPAPSDAAASPAAGDPPAPSDPATLLAGAPIEGVQPPPAAAPVVPETYALVLPEQGHLDAAALERLSAVAKAIGLTSTESAQALVDATNAELAKQVEVLQAATVKGGVIYAETVKGFTRDALADPDIGGTPERLAQTVEHAQAALARYDAGGQFTAFLEQSGWGSSPSVLKFLAGVHADTREDRMPRGAPPAPAPKTLGETFYPGMNQG